MSRQISKDDVWAQRYESLRQDFLGGSRFLEIPPLGMLFLIRDGLACWMRAWDQQSDSSLDSFNSIAPISPPASGWQRDLTFLLARLTTLHLQPIPL